MKLSKLVGGMLMIVGTTIGAGILALPVTTSSSGFITSSLLLFGCWLLMSLCALMLLEVNVWFPEGSHYISMIRATLGIKSEVLAWVCMLLLLYALLCAYIAGGSDIIAYLLGLAHIKLSPAWTALLFTVILGSIVLAGTHMVDYSNRGLMTVKLLSLIMLITMIAPHVHGVYLLQGEPRTFFMAIMVMVASFGYATILPSLRTYFNSDLAALRRIVLLGSGIPLICYIAWDFAILGTIPRQGPISLQTVLASGHVTNELMQAMATIINRHTITRLSEFFSTICMVTSFLGVALSLKDFLADGTRLSKQGKALIALGILTFLPPLLVVTFYPEAFVKALNYAGILCVILLILFPVILVWRGQKRMQRLCQWPWLGSPWLLGILGLIGCILLVLGVVNVT